ncbi:gliding motility lipoprotein GldB [Sphingobacterium psychroaquaticum]|uniref:Gliding motility-associated lipoprotein GldB n=1 Tax=Sphingobacterium psychroaquaticum TaxID=561061 RepID=A0A1X7K3H9_9SPHI|nr:gliding motility lipoprotein GldB [Sphingobacterium psychroaquaticum]SMG34857.1 gliding motility-associated lipoprotein GldB [Sphingobacterium psychroaquaticum]
MPSFRLFFPFGLFFFVCLLSCQSNKKTPDISHIKADVKIERFDQELAQLDTLSVPKQNKLWQTKYAPFYQDFMLHMLEVGDARDTLYIDYMMKRILQQEDFKNLAAAVAEKYPSLQTQEKELSLAMRYMKYYFPAYNVPRFYSFFSGFSVQVPIGEGYVGIGLDMFLGSDSKFYPSLVRDIPLYLSRRFTPENITPRVVESILRQDLYPPDENNTSSLQHMVYQGKILLAMDSILPETADSLKIGYTAKQLEWAKGYEGEVWSWFLQEDLLYNTDHLRIQKYFTEGPFTAELGENNESAPKLGTYLGWMLVRKYMERNPEVTLKALLANSNAQEILEQSKYKGK